MRFNDLSIRIKLVAILIFMVLTPTVILGVLLFTKFRSDVIENTKKELSSIAQNWQTITNSYVQQEGRVLKREQALVEQRLETTVLTAKKILEFTSNGASRENAYNEISKITLGRSGYAFIIDKNGKYILSKDRLRDGENLWQMTNAKGEYFIQDIIAKVRTLAGDDTYITTYEWKEIGDTKLRKILVTFAYSKATDLILGVGNYYSDFQSADLKIILQDELRARMSAQKIKDHGYVMAINSAGEYLVSKDNFRNGENILNYQDEDGNYLVKNIIAESTKLGQGETYNSTIYKWKNIGEDTPDDRLTTFVYVPEWGWIIGATAYEHDYLETINTIRSYIILMGFLMVIIGLLVSYRFALYITKPIEGLEDIALKAIKGDLGIRVSSSLLGEGAEIGSLAKSFNNMIINADQSITKLNTSNKEITQTSKILESKNSELKNSKLAILNLLEDIEEEKKKVEQKVVERTKELSEEHGRMASLLESIRLGVVMVNLNFNVLSANLAAKEILKKKPEENLVFNDLENGMKPLHFAHSLSYYVREKKVVNVQEVKFKDRYYRLFLSPVRDIARQEFIGAVIIMEDITAAKIVDQMRTEIVSTTSHQLRTPLSVIKGNLEMIINGDLGKVPKGQVEVLQEALAGNERLIHLVNDLTDISKITEGRLGLDFKDENFASVVEEVVQGLIPFASQNKVELIFKPSKESILVKIDSQRIKQVIQNLIDNAVKYSPHDGSGKIEVSLESVDHLVELIVKDNGAGIPKAEQSKIFERFFRASNATKLDPGGGTGLGLFITKSIIELHKGKIWFESEEGKVTIFYLTLPVVVSEEKE